MQEKSEKYEIDIIELVFVWLRKWWLLMIVGMLTSVMAVVGTKTLMTPMYQSYSMIYLLPKSTTITSLVDMQIGLQITDDFLILAKTPEVVEKVIESEGLNTTYGKLSGKISVSNPENTRILKIAVTDEDPQTACDIANAMAEVTAQAVADVMKTDKPNVVRKARVSSNPVSPNTFKNMILGGAAGVLLTMGILFIGYIKNDSLQTEEQVQKYLQQNVLATIPKIESVEERSKRKRRRKSR